MSKLFTFFALLLAAAIAVAQTPCDQLKLSFPDVTVKSIESIPAGPFAAPTGSLTPTLPALDGAAPGGRGGRGAGGQAKGPAGGGRAPQAPLPVPAYCRVLMVLTPSSDSLIDTAVFLPTENWNGKLQVVGNGGWAGTRQLSRDGGGSARRLRDRFE